MATDPADIPGEITWEELQTESKSPAPLSEYTSVTRKLRRVARFDWEAAKYAAMLNRPTRIAANFMDYIDFENRYASDWSSLTEQARTFVERLETLTNAPAAYIGTGPALSETVFRPETFEHPNTTPVEPTAQIYSVRRPQ